MNENQTLDDEEVPGILGAVWPIEKYRFYLNLFVLFVLVSPFLVNLIAKDGSFALFQFLVEQYFKANGTELLITLGIYNLIFCSFYLIERWEIRKHRKLLSSSDRGKIFRLFLFLVLIHLLLRLSGKLDDLYLFFDQPFY